MRLQSICNSPDFAGGKPLTALMALLEPGTAPGTARSDGIRLPEDASALVLWVRSSSPDDRLIVNARLRDAQGRFFDIRLGTMGFRDWRQVQGELTPLSPSGFPLSSGELTPITTPPFSLMSLYLTNSFGDLEPGALFLGRLAAVTPSGEVVLDDFQDLERWHVLEDNSQAGVSYYALETSELPLPVGTGKPAAFSWAAGGVGLKGIRFGQPEEPVKAIVSSSLLEDAQARVGDTINVSLSTYSLLLEVVAVADYFPTLDPDEAAFAVTDLKTFTVAANTHSPRPVGGSNEVWINLKDQVSSVDAVTGFLAGKDVRVRDARSAADLVSQNVDQPLVNAGWGALLVLVFLVLALASASGVMLFSYIDMRERQTEFALLRTLGSSRWQLNGVVCFGVALVVVCGIGLGTVAGFLFAAGLLPALGHAEEGARVVPPMVLKIDWTALLVSYLVLALVTAGTVAWLAWFSAKIEVQRALRIGE